MSGKYVISRILTILAVALIGFASVIFHSDPTSAQSAPIVSVEQAYVNYTTGDAIVLSIGDFGTSTKARQAVKSASASTVRQSFTTFSDVTFVSRDTVVNTTATQVYTMSNTSTGQGAILVFASVDQYVYIVMYMGLSEDAQAYANYLVLEVFTTDGELPEPFPGFEIYDGVLN